MHPSVSAELDRPDIMFGTYDLERMKLPSGRGDDAPETHSAETSDRLDAWLERAYPGGIESVMPEDVLSNGKVEPYDVLPRQAGLLQLVRSGQLSVLSDRSFSIDRPIPRFPAGLGGSHSATRCASATTCWTGSTSRVERWKVER